MAEQNITTLYVLMIAQWERPGDQLHKVFLQFIQKQSKKRERELLQRNRKGLSIFEVGRWSKKGKDYVGF